MSSALMAASSGEQPRWCPKMFCLSSASMTASSGQEQDVVGPGQCQNLPYHLRTSMCKEDLS